MEADGFSPLVAFTMNNPNLPNPVVRPRCERGYLSSQAKEFSPHHFRKHPPAHGTTTR